MREQYSKISKSAKNDFKKTQSQERFKRQSKKQKLNCANLVSYVMVSFLQVCETRSNIESCRKSQTSHTIFIFWQINTDSDPVDKKTIPLWKWWCIVNETINTILIKNSKLKKRKFHSIGSSNDHFEKKIASLMRCIKEKKKDERKSLKKPGMEITDLQLLSVIVRHSNLGESDIGNFT